MFDSLKRKYINWQIRSQKVKRQKAFVDWSSASDVVVLLSLDSPNNKLIETILTMLQEKNVSLWCYIPTKDYIRQDFQSVTYIKSDSVSFFQKPNKIITNKFLAQPADLLLDLTTKEVLPTKYLAGISNATCRCGLKKPDYGFYDFEISSTGKMKEAELLEQILHYLSIIKTKK